MPSLQKVLKDQEKAGELSLCLDGMFIHTDGVTTRKVAHTSDNDDTGGNSHTHETIG